VRVVDNEGDGGTLEQIGKLQVGELLAGGDLVQPQSLGEPALRVDQRDRGVVAASDPTCQAHRRGHAGVPGADDDDLVHGFAFRAVCVNTHQTDLAADFVTSRKAASIMISASNPGHRTLYAPRMGFAWGIRFATDETV
jgi:hypothetical protein